MGTEFPMAGEVYEMGGVPVEAEHIHISLSPGSSKVIDVRDRDYIAIVIDEDETDEPDDDTPTRIGRAFGIILTVMIGIPLIFLAFLLIVFLILKLANGIGDLA